MVSRLLARFKGSADAGQDMAEYGILIGLIAVAVMVSLLFLGDRLNAVWENISTIFAAAVD